VIKFVMCLTRHPDMTRQQFQDYWLNQHGPFFQKHAGDLRSKKYIQSHTIDTPMNDLLRMSRGMLPEFDGIAEVWFESEEDMVAAMSSLEGMKLATELLEDENKFIDHSKSSAFIVREEEL
jgi:uncharacterized protein (TIGR02118 family)